MSRGGERPGAGRPIGSRNVHRLTPDDVRVWVESVRQPGESDAAVAQRFGVARQALSRALRDGVGSATLAGWIAQAVVQGDVSTARKRCT